MAIEIGKKVRLIQVHDFGDPSPYENRARQHLNQVAEVIDKNEDSTWMIRFDSGFRYSAYPTEIEEA